MRAAFVIVLLTTLSLAGCLSDEPASRRASSAESDDHVAWQRDLDMTIKSGEVSHGWTLTSSRPEGHVVVRIDTPTLDARGSPLCIRYQAPRDAATYGDCEPFQPSAAPYFSGGSDVVLDIAGPFWPGS